uniref:Uncharacterized protein n=1 Tax=Romanomermis culicivorax TaxID=13658 RepID=A0A915I9C8_ROMCU
MQKPWMWAQNAGHEDEQESVYRDNCSAKMFTARFSLEKLPKAPTTQENAETDGEAINPSADKPSTV